MDICSKGMRGPVFAIEHPASFPWLIIAPFIAGAQGCCVRQRRDALQRLQPRGDAQRVQEVRLRHRPVAGGVRAALRDRLPGPQCPSAERAGRRGTLMIRLELSWLLLHPSGSSQITTDANESPIDFGRPYGPSYFTTQHVPGLLGNRHL